MTRHDALISASDPELSTSERLVIGLEAIIDASSGILSQQSLAETVQAMADALLPIVPYTSLAVYEVDWGNRVGIPLLATGRYVEETLSSKPPLDRSITGKAVLQNKLMYSAPGDPDLNIAVIPGTPVTDMESIVVAPLRVGGQVEGTLNIWREDDDVWFKPHELTLIERFATLAAIAYVNSMQREQLRTQALTDALTGLFNRRHFENTLRAALEDGRRRGEPTSVAYFDIDAFKAINDRFGHACGDDVLCAFALALRSFTRAGDVPCRIGGEEFCVVLPRTDLAQAAALAERINFEIRAAGLGPSRDMTVSVGVATADRSQDDVDRLMLRADKALLRAKRSGRDRIVVDGRPAG
ncbi:MAG TPA: sensor domain-containing diguanylate cyclase [Solirubrobacteraceae bacterium]|nr:sensor domain-containing diguanylate cyclase [Solirubrobacteraceae bacterium]